MCALKYEVIRSCISLRHTNQNQCQCLLDVVSFDILVNIHRVIFKETARSITAKSTAFEDQESIKAVWTAEYNPLQFSSQSAYLPDRNAVYS
ncbi:hypothetical protein LENED_010918 [Lentinula edodes]|uniref:Uncharacterized protein n=1 Tax=Lentinula edodes TaxID=5353 RepID=A0A1Q3ENQ7_LENED|nr:hypothetical protein LENED_010918 [Lentinula edodes]